MTIGIISYLHLSPQFLNDRAGLAIAKKQYSFAHSFLTYLLYIMNLFDIQQTEFVGRHIGPNEAETSQMLDTIGVSSLEELVSKTVPGAIRMQHPLAVPAAMSESDYLRHLKDVSLKNHVFRNYIGQGITILSLQ